jgi:hypothetical protein
MRSIVLYILALILIPILVLVYQATGPGAYVRVNNQLYVIKIGGNAK